MRRNTANRLVVASCVGVLLSAFLWRAHRGAPARTHAPRGENRLCVVESPDPGRFTSAVVGGTSTAAGSAWSRASQNAASGTRDPREFLEEADTKTLISSLVRDAKGGHERRLRYTQGLLIDQLASQPECLDHALSEVRANPDPEAIAALMQAIECFAKEATPDQRRHLEREFMDVLRGDGPEPVRKAAMHYLLMAAGRGKLEPEAIESARTMANRDASGVVRAGSLWLVTGAADLGQRDRILLSALDRDADPVVRATAAEGLGSLGAGDMSSDVQRRVLGLMERESESSVRKRLAGSLCHRGVLDPAEAALSLARMTQSESNPELRRELAATLFVVGGASARTWMEAWRSDPVLGRDVAVYLALMRGEVAERRVR